VQQEHLERRAHLSHIDAAIARKPPLRGRLPPQHEAMVFTLLMRTLTD
jgi:hypothetical protein